MHPFPHVYHAATCGGPAAMLTVTSPGLPDIPSAPPPEFDGPGGAWSPETLLCAAVADCFALTFKAMARASKLDWLTLECRVAGTLERIEGVSRFTRYAVHATLRVSPDTDSAKARLLLEKAERGCLITNSLNGTRDLVAEVIAV